MSQLSIEICSNVAEANARKNIIQSANPGANWVSRVIENIDFVMPFLVPNLANNPMPLPPVFSPQTGSPSTPAVVLLIWTEN